MTDTTADLFADSPITSDLLDRLDDPAIEHQWEGTLADMLACSQAALERAGQAPEQTHKLAQIVVLALADYMGGRALYLPRGHALKTALRDQQIWREFRGNNVRLLARRYKLCEQAVYRIIQRQRAIQRARVQHALF